MKRYNYYFITGLVLCLMGSNLFAQTQIGKVSFLKNNLITFVGLEGQTSLELASVTNDELIINRLESGENGYLDIMLDNVAAAEFTLGLEEEGGGQVFELVFNNAMVSVLGTTQNVLDGDFFRIQRCADEVLFYQNSDLLASASIVNNNFSLLARLKVTAGFLDGNGNRPFISMEFPTVTVNCPPPPNRKSFIQLKKKLDAAYTNVTDGKLRFSYDEDYAIVAGVNDEVSYQVYDINYQPVSTMAGVLDNNYGINWHEINTESLNQYWFYVLEIKGVSKDEVYYLRFRNE